LLQRYRSRLSGPLLDRIDLQIEAPRVPHKDLTGQAPAESSASIRQRVNQARQIQRERLAPFGLHANSQIQARHIRRFCKLDAKGDQLGLSARSFTRILKRTRTIADFAGSEQIDTLHLSEAIQYRGLDRKLGGD